jgi:hypothetical protein
MIRKGLRDRLRYRIHRAAGAQGAGHLAVGAGFAARDAAGDLVDPLVEGGNAGHIQRDIGKIGLAAAVAIPSIAIAIFSGGRNSRASG